MERSRATGEHRVDGGDDSDPTSARIALDRTILLRVVCPVLLFLLPAAALWGAPFPSSARSRAVLARQTPSLQRDFRAAGLTLGSPIFLRIFKAERELEVWVRTGASYRRFTTYPVAAYGGTLGPKLRRGDRQAPEGFYYVTPAALNPNSRFHLSLDIGYPNRYDRLHGRTGSAIMIHGNRVSIGCFAMTDAVIERIYTIAYRAFESGQPFFRVHIFPFRMTDENLVQFADSRHRAFWGNLKQGYDLFEETKVDPNVEVRRGRYVFDLNR